MPADSPPSGTPLQDVPPALGHSPALVFTSSGWIRGQFHVPVMHGFLGFLNRMGELLKLTDVTLPHLKREVAFFGLRRDSAIMIIPDCDEDLLSLPTITGNAETHQTSFLMASGSVSGDMTIEADIRVSDYLNQGKWVVLRNCQVGSHGGPGGRRQVATFPLLVLTTPRVIGTSDESLSVTNRTFWSSATLTLKARVPIVFCLHLKLTICCHQFVVALLSPINNNARALFPLNMTLSQHPSELSQTAALWLLARTVTAQQGRPGVFRQHKRSSAAATLRMCWL